MPKAYWGGMAALILLASLPLFMHLDTLPLFIYDEARLANNALEMALNGDWLVVHYQGEPDLWNTKPPLLIWIQALSMKALGFDTLALRLPSALAGLATILVLFHFMWRQTRSLLPAMGAALALLCTPGFITLHATRTGDYDALLALWSTLFLLHFYNYFQYGARKYIWYALAFFTLGTLTKGIVVFLFLPALFIYLLASRKLVPLLRQPHLYYAVMASVGAIAAYYLGREAAAPGYLKAVAENELWGRYLQVVESHEAPWYFYFQKLWESEFIPWVGFLPLAVWWAFRDADERRRPLWGFLLWLALGFLLALSFSQTKIAWYAVPVFPLLGLAVGGALGVLATQLTAPRVVKVFLMLGIFLSPYVWQVEQSSRLKDFLFGWEQRQYAGMMRELSHWPGYTVVISGYNAHVAFYAQAFRHKGQDISVKYAADVTPGESVLICEDKPRDQVGGRLRMETMYQRKNCGIYQVHEK